MTQIQCQHIWGGTDPPTLKPCQIVHRFQLLRMQIDPTVRINPFSNPHDPTVINLHLKFSIINHV